MSTKIKKILIAVVTLVSLALIFNRPIKEGLIHSFHPTLNSQVINQNKDKKATYDYGQVKRLTMSNIAAARANARNLKIVGVITIPSINLNLPISKGITNQNLALSAGTFRPDMKMGQGNYALAGHNMSNLGPTVLFSPLYFKGKVGQRVYITNLKKIYEYQITEKKFISKYDTQVVANTHQRMITLVTCDATGANRLMVRGKYLKKFNYHDAPASLRKDISRNYNLHH